MLAFSCFGGNATVCKKLVKHFNYRPARLIHSIELFSFVKLTLLNFKCVLHFLIKIQQDDPSQCPE